MVALQLFIGSEQVELHDNESIILTQELQNVLDIRKIFTDYTRTFNVPASKNNNKIFKHYHNPAIKGFDAREKKPAVLHANYKPFKEGFIRLESVQMHNNSPKNYRITFFGSLITIDNKIGDAELKDLGALGFTINYSPSNIRAGMQTGADVLVGDTQINEALLYPLISAKDRWIYNSGDDTASSSNIHYGSNSKGIFVEHLKPAIRLHAIIKAIEVKYDLEFSEDFFSSTNAPYYNLYLWLNKQKGVFKNNDATSPPSLTYSPWENIKGINDIAKGFYGGGATTFFAEYRNQGSYTGNRFLVVGITAPLDAKFNFKIEHQNGDGIILDQDLTGTGNREAIIKLSDGEILKKPYNPWDFSGSVYYFTISGSQDASIKVDVSVFTAQRYPASTPLDEIRASADFTVSTTSSYFSSPVLEMPKIKIIDFLTGLFKLFNLTATVTDNIISVRTLDDFYSASTTTYDITKYLDKTDSLVQLALPYRNISFKFEGNESFFNAFHTQIHQIGWGDLFHETKMTGAGGDYTIEVPFEHHQFERLSDSNTGATTSIQWGWSVNQDQEEYVGKPLLFYPYKITGGDAISVMDSVGGTFHSLTSYYIPSNNINPTDATTQSIHFGAERNEYSPANTLRVSLFSTYYKSYIEETLNESRRLFTFSAYLPQSIIYNIKLNDKVIIFNTLYKINKLTTNFQNNLTTLELVNELEDFDVPALNVVQDLVQTIDTNIATADLNKVTIDKNIPIYNIP